MGQQWDQEIKQKIPWNKCKWGHNNPQSLEHWESNPKREIYSITGLTQKIEKEKEKAQIKDLSSHLKELEKEQQTKHKVSRRNEIINITAEISEIDSKTRYRRIQELVLWKDKQNWQIFNHTQQEKKEIVPQKTKSEMKEK